MQRTQTRLVPDTSRRWFTLALLVLAAVALSGCRSEVSDVTANESGSTTANAAEPSPQTGSEPTAEPADPPDPAEPADPAEEASGEEAPGGVSGEPQFELMGDISLATEDLNSLVAFVEDEAGRDFLRPPVIVAQSTDEFTAGLLPDVEDLQADSETSVRTLQALGLTDKGVAEVTAAFEALLLSPEGVLGYYDPESDAVYVPNDALADDDFRSLLVHELTHALDGQHADLSRLRTLSEEALETGDWEPVGALQAVGEGRATAVQNAWMNENGVVQLVPDDLGAIAEVPPAMMLSLSLPYVFGEVYILSKGGPANTWDLLDNPPPSSEVFLIPGTSESEPIIDVAAPQAEGEILEEIVFGGSDLLVWLLGESLEPDPALLLPTVSAVDGWAGGRSVLWGDDRESCVRIALVADSEADLLEIEEAIAIWAADDADRSVERDGDQVIATGCAPYVP